MTSESGIWSKRDVCCQLTQHDGSMFVCSPDPAQGRHSDKVVAEVDKQVDTLPATEVVCILLLSPLQVAASRL